MADIAAWKDNILSRWIYIKSNLCDIQSVKWYPCPVEPDKSDFPVIIRPLINLSGMGSEVSIAEDLDEYREMSCYGYFATPFIEGQHSSHDYILKKGVPTSETTFIGHKDSQNTEHVGAFLYWELTKLKEPPTITRNIQLLLNRLTHYSGPLNIECINGVIIEAHLRNGDNDLIRGNKPPLYLVPIWGSIYDEAQERRLDRANLLKQPGVIDVVEDTHKISKTGKFLQRRALVITKILPESLK